jgi:hypothetical protein
MADEGRSAEIRIPEAGIGDEQNSNTEAPD